MKKNNFSFTTEKFHLNHLESPVNGYVDKITEKIFPHYSLSKSNYAFKYVTIWLDQMRIGILKTELSPTKEVLCYLKPRLEFTSRYKVNDLLNFISQIVDSLYNSNSFKNKYLIYADTAQGQGKIILPKNNNLKFKKIKLEI